MSGRALRNAVLGALAVAVTWPLASAGVGAATRGNSSAERRWVDEAVSFGAGSLTVYATFRHPVGEKGRVPGVLLIAGSGPTDRNGNSSLLPGPIDNLRELAAWLSDDGVASLRYDKLGSGQTGLGPYASDPSAIGIAPYEQESLAALEFLAAQPGVDAARLGVFGHSEGALFALLLATGHAGVAPTVRALGLLEPLSVRYLDVIAAQVDAQVAAQARAGQITSVLAAQVRTTLAGAVSQVRRSGTGPADLPYGLGSILNTSTYRFLAQADHYDPAALGASLRRGTPVLVSCSDADVEVSCHEVDHLVGGLRASHGRVDFIHLHGVDHVLKVDPSLTGSNYTKDLPFSPQLRVALNQFVDRNLRG